MPLTEQVYILGRATTQGETAPGYMFFYEPTVSRVHAELRWNEKKKSYFLHHQSKTNPTLVEGVPVDKKSPRPLEKGSKIQMGYLVLEVEDATAASGKGTDAPARSGAAAASVGTGTGSVKKENESAKTHKMMVGNILEALSNLNQERNNARVAPPAAAVEARQQPRATDPEPPKAPGPGFLERDYGASERGSNEIQFTVAQGPDQGEVFVLREQVGVIGRSQGREDPRRGQGVLLHDDSLPKEAAFVVWQSRDQAYGLTEADGPGVAIRVRRVQQGHPMDFNVTGGAPVLLYDGDVVQLGRTSLVVRAKGAPPLKEWSPQDVERPARPGTLAESSPWAPKPAATSGGSGGIVPRNFPGANSGALNSGNLSEPAPPPTPAPVEPTELPTTPTSRTPPVPSPPPRSAPTLIGRGAGSSLLSARPEPAPTPAPTPAPDLSNAATLGTASSASAATGASPSGATTVSGASTAVRPGAASGPLATTPEERNEALPLSWPWRDNSDWVFDFVSGPNRGRQIALNANEMQDDRVITLGSETAGHFDIPLDGTHLMAALRYRSRRFALLNQGPDDSILVNKVPLKRGDQVVLMTGDRIDMGESTFRFLERTVVEVLQSFQVVVESGVDQDQDKVYPFFKQRLLIGRGKNCDVRLTDLEVSRIHVALVHRDGKFFVQHRSETNPTFLNGMSLLQGGERLISPGDRIRLSSLTLLQFTKAEPRKRSAFSASR